MAITVKVEKSPVPAAPPPSAAPEDPKSILPDTSVDALSRAFRFYAGQAEAQHKALRPTLAKLNEVVSKFQALGNDNIGIELATFDRLRDYGLSRQDGSFDSSHFCILSIYDARFLIRLYEGSKIDCFPDNLNKPAAFIQAPDSDEFNYAAERTGGRVNRAAPKFTRYDLSQEDDVLTFTHAIVQTAGYLSSYNSLREFDVKPAEDKQLPKTALPRVKTP